MLQLPALADQPPGGAARSGARWRPPSNPKQVNAGKTMPQRALYIAAYDVTEPSRLRLALNIAKAFATGGQKSVFECYLSAAERRELIGRMRAALDPKEDRFALVRIEPRARALVLGIAVAPADPDYFYVG